MRHTQAWIDSLTNNLMTANQFFNPKSWSAEHNTIWQNAMSGYTANEITEAFQTYYSRGKHMPKPSEIISIIRELHPRKTDRERNDQRILDDESKQENHDCCPIIASANMIFNRLQSGLNIRFPYPDGATKRVPMTDEQAILICNYEAKRFNDPDAIDETFWLTEVWGKPKPKRTMEQRLAALRKPRKSRSDFGPTPDYSTLLGRQAA